MGRVWLPDYNARHQDVGAPRQRQGHARKAAEDGEPPRPLVK
jgi:hypothetical protein